LKTYSFTTPFTTPSKKPLFKEDTKLWLLLIIISIGIYILFTLFLLLKSYLFVKDAENLKKEIEINKATISSINLEKEFIFKQKALFEEINIKNQLTKQQIKNLLDLVPDPITLERFYIDNDKLIIYGITPTKDVYNLLMLPPLESIFYKTITVFYEMPNGWYKFKSENYLKSENEKN